MSHVVVPMEVAAWSGENTVQVAGICREGSAEAVRPKLSCGGMHLSSPSSPNHIKLKEEFPKSPVASCGGIFEFHGNLATGIKRSFNLYPEQ